MKYVVQAIMCVMFLGMLAGCTKPVHKDWIPVGGSKSDATVKLAYTYDPNYENPIVQEEQAVDLAIRKCRTWGYESAEAFGGYMEHCTRMGPVLLGEIGCVQMAVVKSFQCIGGMTIKTE